MTDSHFKTESARRLFSASVQFFRENFGSDINTTDVLSVLELWLDYSDSQDARSNSGIDKYTHAFALVFGIDDGDVTKEQRDLCKRFALALGYAGKPRTRVSQAYGPGKSENLVLNVAQSIDQFMHAAGYVDEDEDVSQGTYITCPACGGIIDPDDEPISTVFNATTERREDTFRCFSCFSNVKVVS